MVFKSRRHSRRHDALRYDRMAGKRQAQHMTMVGALPEDALQPLA